RRTLLLAAVALAAALLAGALAPGRDRAALGVVVLVAVGAAGALLTAQVRARRVVARALLCAGALDVALLATFFFSATTDVALATGAAMAICLLGLSFLTGVSGQISLGHAALMGVGALVAAIWANHHATTPIVVNLLICLVAGALVGLALGLPATRLRGPYLAGMTLAFSVAFGPIVNSFTSWTGGDAGLQLPHPANPPTWLTHLYARGTALFTTNTAWVTDLILVVAAVAFFFMSNLFDSRTGRAMRLVRDNDVAAELVGVSLPRTRVVAFVVSSAYAALGGACWTLLNNAVTPPAYSFALSITILSLVVIGGIGTISGALVGGVVYAYSTSVISWFVNHTGLNPQGNLASQLNGIVFGVLLIGAMLFAPRGLVGSLRVALARRVAQRSPAPGPTLGARGPGIPVSNQGEGS
ncbi:MAG: branched-chain amino acid ABC transporter permease, partial [Acidobacteriota bacterium]|nr:branched-chain amino acid ABC transporter permease [Acidobacteriota bacterium]